MRSPVRVAELLEQLGMTDASYDRKVSAIREWLPAHEPSAPLVHNLRASPYAEVLDVLDSALVERLVAGHEAFLARIWDDEGFLKPGEPMPIHFVEELCRHLDVVAAPHDAVLAAIRGWLAENRPSGLLLRDLEQSEFADTLDVLG